MPQSLYSTNWYRVAGLKPRLRSHIEIHRHHYRDELWYVMQDHSSGRFQRFTPAAYQLIGLMDGRRTVQEIWDAGRARLGEDAPTQEDFVRLLSQLHAVDALQGDVQPDPAELAKRLEKRRFGWWKQSIRSPLFVRFPMLDPERFLTRFRWLARPIFSWPGLVLWLVVVIPALIQVGVHWTELTQNLADRVLAPQNLLILWLTFPFLKAFHEFGHAFAVKTRGGEVHEMGIMLLVFTPIPYVDASAASAFRKKRERALVGAAGMLIEFFFAALAVYVWLNAQPGPLRAVAFNVMLIAGVSSVLFNGNPLLRYDAYYILLDILEIPNLGSRGTRYLFYLIQRYLLGIKDMEPPLSTPGERVWFVVYTICAFLYRMSIYTAIVLFVAGKFFFVGVLFALWAAVNMLVIPVFKGLRFLFTSPQLNRRRLRAMAVSGLTIAAAAVVIVLVPVSLSTIAEGVIWIPDESFVRAGADGFVERIMAQPGEYVQENNPLIVCVDPLLPAQIRVLESRLRELKAVYTSQILKDRVAADITKDEMAHVRAQLEDARGREAELTIHSKHRGVFVAPMPEDMPGRFVHRGELLGYVLDPSTIAARVVVDQSDVDFVRSRTRSVTVRLPENFAQKVPAIIRRIVPAATDQLPSRTLSREGGGDIAIDPRDAMGTKAYQKVFLFDVELLEQMTSYTVGGRVYVRFDHGKEPLFHRWYRSVRKLLLKRFNV
jgi:putative peptide zinc metalloprotease protein